MENVINITNKFLDQIQALFIMAEKEVIRKPILEKEPSLDDLFDFILHYKSLRIKSGQPEDEAEEVEEVEVEVEVEVDVDENEEIDVEKEDQIQKGNELSEEDIKFLFKFEELSKENKMMKHLIENINLVETEEGFLIETTSPLTSSLSKNFSKNRRYHNTENDIYINSLIISMVTSFELLVSDLIKDYALSNKNPNFFNNDKIDYKTLTQIGDINIAKEFLIDRYLEGVLRGSVTDWLSELEKISGNINFNELTNNKKLLIETFQRRHLLVHNNGVVNNLYLSNVDPSLTKELVQGAQLETSKEYIKSRISIIREIGLLLSYKYFTIIYKDKKNEIYSTFQEHIIHRIPKDCKASESIFQSVMRDNKYTDNFKLLAKINYWLVKKFNSTFHEVEDEVRKFDVSTLKPQYQMAKYLLLDEKEKGFDKFVEFSKSIEIDELFYSLEWPILKLLDGDEKLQEFRKLTIDSLFESKEESLNE